MDGQDNGHESETYRAIRSQNETFVEREIQKGGFHVRLRVDGAGGSWAGAQIVPANDVRQSRLVPRDLIRQAIDRLSRSMEIKT